MQKHLPIASRTGWPSVRSMESIGCPPWTTRVNFATWISPAGTRLCGYASSRCTARCATLYEQIAQPGTFLVSATGLVDSTATTKPGAVAPLGGAVVGFSKAYKRERPESLVKAVDFESERKAIGNCRNPAPRDPARPGRCRDRLQSQDCAGPSACRNNLRPTASPA